MKIYWVSNAPFVPSGYGQQTGLFARLLVKAGHEVVVRGFFGHRGAIMNLGGVKVLPGSYRDWGNDAIADDYARLKPDAAVLLLDLWVVDDAVLKSAPLTAYAPVDHDPLPGVIADKLKLCRYQWAMSRFAERQMRAIGLTPTYVPHGVDTDVFVPSNRSAARARLGFSADAFVAVMVAANKGFPSRKSIDRVLKAWGRFVARHPGSVLFMHTEPHGVHNGLDVLAAAQFYGIPQSSLRFPDGPGLRDGEFGPEHLNVLYNAADVKLLPSMGEGFGIPVIEAQAAGCPVIVTDFTAQSELAGPGYKIALDPFDDLIYTLQNSEMASVRPSAILDALEWAYERCGDETLRAESREFAMQYDHRRVFRDYLLPALEMQTGEAQAQALRTAARLALRAGKREMQAVPSRNGQRQPEAV